MSDLASLLQTSPYAAGYMISQNNVDDRQSKLLEQEKLRQLISQLQQEQQFAAQANPLKLQETQQNLDYNNQVKLPQGLANLTKTQLDNQATQATQPGAIAATDAKNRLTTATDTTGLARDMQGRLMTIGATVNSAPPPMRMQAFQQALQDQGIDPNHPLAQGMVSQLQSRDPNAFASYIKNQADVFGDIASKQDAAYRGRTYTADKNLEGDRVKASATVEASRIAAQAREHVADARKDTDNFWTSYNKEKTALGQYNRLASEAKKRALADDTDGAAKLREMAMEVYPRAQAELAKAASQKPDLNAMGIQTQTPGVLPPIEDVSGKGGPGAAGFTGKTKSGVGFKVISE